MSQLEVDLEALDDLVRRLRDLRVQLDSLGRDIGRYDDAIGSRRLAGKFSELAGNWRKHRQRLAEDLEALAAMTGGAAAQYRQIEADVSSAVTGAERGG